MLRAAQEGTAAEQAHDPDAKRVHEELAAL